MDAMVLKNNDLALREFLNPTAPAVLEKDAIIQASSSLVETILSTNTLETLKETSEGLAKLYNGLKCVFDVAEVPEPLRKRQFLNKTGLAMSPQNAIHTIKDTFRVSGFVRAIDKAIDDLKAVFDEPLHIMYPACGPLAPLMLPLLAYYKQTGKRDPEDIMVTLIDVQEGAVMSLKKVFEASGLDCFLKRILFADAADYVKQPDEKIHMVVLEAMQHGFSKEGQLAIAIHFSKLLEDKGLFLPEKVSIEGALITGQKEFVEQWRDKEFTHAASMDNDILKQRINMGSIFEVSLQSIKNLDIVEVDEYTKLIRCASLKIPEYKLERGENEKILLFCTKVNIYKGEMINEYDSGITHPLPDQSICINFTPKNDLKPEDLLVNSGDTLDFFYRMNGLPGFLVVKADAAQPQC